MERRHSKFYKLLLETKSNQQTKLGKYGNLFYTIMNCNRVINQIKILHEIQTEHQYNLRYENIREGKNSAYQMHKFHIKFNVIICENCEIVSVRLWNNFRHNAKSCFTLNSKTTMDIDNQCFFFLQKYAKEIFHNVRIEWKNPLATSCMYNPYQRTTGSTTNYTVNILSHFYCFINTNEFILYGINLKILTGN